MSIEKYRKYEVVLNIKDIENPIVNGDQIENVIKAAGEKRIIKINKEFYNMAYFMCAVPIGKVSAIDTAKNILSEKKAKRQELASFLERTSQTNEKYGRDMTKYHKEVSDLDLEIRSIESDIKKEEAKLLN